MTDLRTAAQQALEALRNYKRSDDDRVSIAMGILSAALAEPVQEPDKSEQGRMRSAVLGNNVKAMMETGLSFMEALDTTLKVYDHPPKQPVQEPGGWAGYDLDGMAEAFSRVIEAHHSSRHPFHNPLDMDAKMALRILRGLIPAMKAYAATPQRKPLTDEEIIKIFAGVLQHGTFFDVVRAIEKAHGIGEKE